MARNIWTKDPQAVLDYSWDWQHWLDEGESIATATVTAPAGITRDSETFNDTSVTVWLSGGTANEVYAVTCQITTDSVPARTDERSIIIRVRER